MGANQSAAPKRMTCSSVSDLLSSLKRNGTTSENIVLAKMKFDKPIANLPVLPGVLKVSFLDSVIKNDSILQFNQWCPNVAELAFIRVKFSERAYENFTNGGNTLPTVKSLTFHFKYDMEGFGYFIQEMDEKLPSLENLALILVAADSDEYEPMWDDEQPYEPIYFKNLKKLSLIAFGDEGDRVFDYMDISNEKLEELSFTAMGFTKDNLKWIKCCEQLNKLTLGCPSLEGNDLKLLKGMKSLKELHLEIGSIEWTPKKMIEIMRNNGQLKLLSIECERNNKQLTFDDEFKKLFDALVQKRGDATIKVTFGSGKSMRQMTISEEGFDETTPLVEAESDDEEFYFETEDGSSSNDIDSDSSSEEEEENEH
ncbi:uncharacterized protein LOC129567612 [Sitodiplosis mosellana]|uniref:uncharacterized protein LOC129567612 n=1 Tax=Sitodiplosis mosellana TaxID=263140 RepID=UPI0024447857|nr:uncharacterized protein LOC129567612 [Sitodiplosis mosellana]